MFKTLATYRVAAFLKLSNDIRTAAVLGSQSELVTAQYFVTGKSIVCKKWYGSYAIRYNLRSRCFEVPWVKYRGCGPEERILVELRRKDRLVFYKKPIYNHPEVIIPPFIPMDQFLCDYKKGFPLPEHDVYKPIRI